MISVLLFITAIYTVAPRTSTTISHCRYSVCFDLMAFLFNSYFLTDSKLLRVEFRVQVL